jgi:hypothetical protein
MNVPMLESWPTDRVSIDLLKRTASGAIKLTTIGSREDIRRLGIRLENGLSIRLWSDDVDDDGNPDPFLLEGVVRWDDVAECWVADVDSQSLRHRSDD